MTFRRSLAHSIMKAGVLGVVGLLAAGASYVVTSGARAAASAPDQQAQSTTVPPDSQPAPFKSGEYLAAYVLVSSECGFSAEVRTMEALARVRRSLRSTHGEAFAGISVIGVVLDKDLAKGYEYVRELGNIDDTFDQVSIGGSWLNEQVTEIVWQKGLATPQLPQILLVRRDVDASQYPRHLEVQDDVVLHTITGRTELLDWVVAGTPLPHPNISAATGA